MSFIIGHLSTGTRLNFYFILNIYLRFEVHYKCALHAYNHFYYKNGLEK